MLIAFAIYFIGILLYAFFLVMWGLSLVLVSIPYVNNIFAWIFGSLLYFNGIFNVVEILKAIIFVLSFTEFIFFAKILMWIIQPIPFIGRMKNPFESKPISQSQWEPDTKQVSYDNSSGRRMTQLYYKARSGIMKMRK
jgi:hypothetical protein